MDEGRHMQRRTNRRRADFSSAGIGQNDDPVEVLQKVTEAFLDRSAQPSSILRKVHTCNALVRMTKKIRAKIDTDDFFCSLLPAFFQDCREVRAAALRCLRKFLTDQPAADSFFKFHFDLCVAKCLDLGCLDEEANLAPMFQSERFQAIKLIRQLTRLGSGRMPASLVQPLLSICRYADREDRRDQLMKASVYLLAEVGALTPAQLAGTGALNTVLHAILDASLPARCTEALIGVLAHLLNRPDTRRHLQPLPESLHCLLSPLTNPASRRSCESRHALLALFRIWPGLLSLSPRSLVAMLFVNSSEARSALVDFFFDLFLVPKPPPGVTDFVEALRCLDPSLESWDLTEGFVAAEGCDLLDYRCPSRLNLLDNYLAFLLHLFVQCGLAHGLASLLADSDSSDQLAVRCALLLGELTHRSRLLPTALRTIGAALSSPGLMRNQRALLWLTAVQRAREKPPRPRNVLLAALLAQSKPASSAAAPSSASASASASACASLAACPDDPDDWAWPEMLGLVRCLQADAATAATAASASTASPASSSSAASPEWLMAVRRLCAFYSPPSAAAGGSATAPSSSASSFLAKPLSWRHATDAYLAGVELMQLLARLPESSELHRCLASLLTNLCAHLRNRLMPAPSLLSGSCARFAPGLLASMTASERGEELLEACNAKQLLLDMVSEQAHPYFAKLVLASVDYSRNGGFGRLLLGKALSCGDEECRLYATQLMTVLLRADMPFFSNWGVELLVKQLYDPLPTVSQAALTVLEEACELEVNKNVLVRLRPAALHLGDQGAVLIAKLCGFSLGFRVLQESNWFQQHFELWRDQLCDRYPLLVEQLLTGALTGYEVPPPGDDFVRPSSRPKVVPRRVLLPTHLFGQLVMHKEGYDFLCGQACVRQAVERVFALLEPAGQQERRWDSEADIVAAKSAVWSLGHIGSTAWGLALLEQERVAPALALLAECCPVLSVRAACFWALCLLAATERGCVLLSELGWEALRSNRSQLYPVVLHRPLATASAATAAASSSTMTATATESSIGDSWRLSQDSVVADGSRASSVSTVDSALHPQGRPHSMSVTSCHWHVTSQQQQQHQLATAQQQQEAASRKARSASASECDAGSASRVSVGPAAVSSATAAAMQPSAVSTWTSGNARALLLQQRRIALGAVAASPSMGALQAAASSSSSLVSPASHRSAAALTKRCGAQAGILYQCLALPCDPVRLTLCACCGGSARCESPAGLAAATSSPPLSSSREYAAAAEAPEASGPTSGYASRTGSKPQLLLAAAESSSYAVSANGGGGGGASGLDLHSEEACIACSLLLHRGQQAPPPEPPPPSEEEARPAGWARRETVRLVGQLACHVNQARNEAALIQLKARQPAAFSQDMCLYSEVALALARHPYSRRARAFVQDLFADAAFDLLYYTPAAK